MQVASVHPNTSVSIYLKLADGGSVSFQGGTYSDGDTVRVELDQYQAAQLTCVDPCDMTGTLVSASRPVAVFSISSLVTLMGTFLGASGNDHFMEQLPPVESYGLDFIVTQQTARVSTDNFCQMYPTVKCDDLVWVVASEYNTTVLTANSSTDVADSHHLALAGDSLSLPLRGPVMQVVADRPVLVAQVFKTLAHNDGALLVVPPLSQYYPQDLVLFTTTNDKQLVVYTAVEPPPSSLTVDGVSYSWDTHIDGPLLNVSFAVVNFSSPTPLYTEVSVGVGEGVGGYISDTGNDETAVALSHGLHWINEVIAAFVVWFEISVLCSTASLA